VYWQALLSAPDLAPLTIIGGKEIPELNKYHAQGQGKKGSYAFKTYALAFLTSFQVCKLGPGCELHLRCAMYS
jgi:hypothetical protein